MNLANYDQLIDSETWKFIEQTEKWYPADTVSFSIERQREIYNAMCREFHQGYPAGVTAVNSMITFQGHSVNTRCYSYLIDNKVSPQALLVYLHGGGFVVGGLDSHDDVCSEICKRTGFEVVSVDYRLSPEHSHPAAFLDSMAVVQQLAHSRQLPVVLCGDSAGGNLAAAVAHALKGQSQSVIGQVLIYPGLGGDIEQGSYITHAHAPMLTTQDVRFYMNIRTGGKPLPQDATLAPLCDTSFHNLPPTLIFSAECDPLSEDGQQYCAAIIRDGGKAFCTIEKGLVHGYLRARTTVARARDSFTRIIDGISMLAEGSWRV